MDAAPLLCANMSQDGSPGSSPKRVSLSPFKSGNGLLMVGLVCGLLLGLGITLLVDPALREARHPSLHPYKHDSNPGLAAGQQLAQLIQQLREGVRQLNRSSWQEQQLGWQQQLLAQQGPASSASGSWPADGSDPHGNNCNNGFLTSPRKVFWSYTNETALSLSEVHHAGAGSAEAPYCDGMGMSNAEQAACRRFKQACHVRTPAAITACMVDCEPSHVTCDCKQSCKPGCCRMTRHAFWQLVLGHALSSLGLQRGDKHCNGQQCFSSFKAVAALCQAMRS